MIPSFAIFLPTIALMSEDFPAPDVPRIVTNLLPI